MFDLGKKYRMLKAILYRKDSRKSSVYYLAMGNSYLSSYLFQLYHFVMSHRKKCWKENKLIQDAFYIVLVA